MLNNNVVEVKGFESLYYVSSSGEVFNKKKKLKTYINNAGYECIDLRDLKGKRYKFLVHRLVALNFLPNPLNKKYVNHLDGNKLNNCLSNLEWVTNSENIVHARRTGLNPYNLPTLGIKKGKGSKYHNVSYDKSRNKWKATIRENGKNLGQKRFDTEDEAALYVNYLIDLHKLSRPKNII